MQGEIVHDKILLAPLHDGRAFHVYCSPQNLGSEAVGLELAAVLKGLRVTNAFSDLKQSEHMLLYLTKATWTRGAASAAFAHEVCEALRAGVHLLLCHEFPSMLGDSDARMACAFNEFWNDGWTPPWLLKGDANVYKQIAIALKGGAWRMAGLTKLGKELAKGGGSRSQWQAQPNEPELAARAPPEHDNRNHNLVAPPAPPTVESAGVGVAAQEALQPAILRDAAMAGWRQVRAARKLTSVFANSPARVAPVLALAQQSQPAGPPGRAQLQRTATFSTLSTKTQGSLRQLARDGLQVSQRALKHDSNSQAVTQRTQWDGASWAVPTVAKDSQLLLGHEAGGGVLLRPLDCTTSEEMKAAEVIAGAIKRWLSRRRRRVAS